MGRRMEPQEVRLAQLRELYTNGCTIAEICKEMGFKTPETPINYLKEMGIYEDYGGIDVPKVLALRRAGWHMADILDEFGGKYTADEIMDAVNEYDRRHRHGTSGGSN